MLKRVFDSLGNFKTYFNKSTHAFASTTFLNKNTLLQSCFILRRLQISPVTTQNMLRKHRKVYINTEIIIKEKEKKKTVI